MFFWDLGKGEQKAVMEKFTDLYIPNGARKRFLVLNSRGHYLTLEYEDGVGNCKYPLTESRIKNHLLGKETLGVFALDRSTSFMCFDVDIDDRWIVEKIIEAIEHLGIPREKIIVSLSGNKGYHIELFFDILTSIDLAFHFFRLVLIEAQVDDVINKIEFRPTKHHGVKLPLGNNFLSKKDDSFCYYIENIGLCQKKGVGYIFDIEKVESKKIYGIVVNQLLKIPTIHEFQEMVKRASKSNASSPTGNKTILQKDSLSQKTSLRASNSRDDDILLCELRHSGTRHNTILKMAITMLNHGYSRDKCNAILHQWMDEQKKGTYDTDLDLCHKDIDRVVHDVYTKKYGARRPSIIKIYKSELIYIVKKAVNYNEQLFLFTLLLQAKKHGCFDGNVAISVKQHAKEMGVTDATIINIKKRLMMYKIIESSQVEVLPKLVNKKPISTYYIPWIVSDDSITNIALEREVNSKKAYKIAITELFDKEDYLFLKKEVKSRIFLPPG